MTSWTYLKNLLWDYGTGHCYKRGRGGGAFDPGWRFFKADWVKKKWPSRGKKYTPLFWLKNKFATPPRFPNPLSVINDHSLGPMKLANVVKWLWCFLDFWREFNLSQMALGVAPVASRSKCYKYHAFHSKCMKIHIIHHSRWLNLDFMYLLLFFHLLVALTVDNYWFLLRENVEFASVFRGKKENGEHGNKSSKDGKKNWFYTLETCRILTEVVAEIRANISANEKCHILPNLRAPDPSEPIPFLTQFLCVFQKTVFMFWHDVSMYIHPLQDPKITTRQWSFITGKLWVENYHHLGSVH